MIRLMILFLLCVTSLSAAAEETLVASYLCEGKATLSGLDPIDGERDQFEFRAKSTVTRMDDGRVSIDYAMPLYLKTARISMYEGHPYLVEWRVTQVPSIVEAKALLVSPLMRDVRQSTSETFERWNALRASEENRYALFGFDGTFRAGVIAEGWKRVGGTESQIRVWKVDRENIRLTLEATFDCPSYAAEVE